ncbi:MAG: M14 family zinc carboxypeptidase, partial [Pseudomonadota bacterium]
MSKTLLALFLCMAALPSIAADSNNKSLEQLKKEAKTEELPSIKAPAGSPAAPVDQRYWIVVHAASREQRTLLSEAGMAIEEIRSDAVEGIAHANTIRKLEAMGFKVEYRVSISQYRKRFLRDFPPQDKAYNNYARMLTKLQGLARSNPRLVSLFSIGKGAQGRYDIWAVRFNTTESGTAPSKKPGAVFVGTHHAREHLSTEVPIALAVYLAANKNDPAVKKMLETRDIYVVP